MCRFSSSVNNSRHCSSFSKLKSIKLFKIHDITAAMSGFGSTCIESDLAKKMDDVNRNFVRKKARKAPLFSKK